jgi:type IV pilus assembly protein PilF
MATAYSKMDEPEKADALFRRSLKLDPDDFETNINYAGHLCRERKFSEAIPFIKTALETSPKNKVALGWLKYAKTYSMKQ